MPRIKRGTTANKRRKNVLKLTKGYNWGRKSKYKSAKVAVNHAMNHAFNDRRKKKGDFRQAWQIQISAASRENGISYSALMGKLKKNNILINRKMLAVIANDHPETFKAVLEKAK